MVAACSAAACWRGRRVSSMKRGVLEAAESDRVNKADGERASSGGGGGPLLRCARASVSVAPAIARRLVLSALTRSERSLRLGGARLLFSRAGPKGRTARLSTQADNAALVRCRVGRGTSRELFSLQPALAQPAKKRSALWSAEKPAHWSPRVAAGANRLPVPISQSGAGISQSATAPAEAGARPLIRRGLYSPEPTLQTVLRLLRVQVPPPERSAKNAHKSTGGTASFGRYSWS